MNCFYLLIFTFLIIDIFQLLECKGIGGSGSSGKGSGSSGKGSGSSGKGSGSSGKGGGSSGKRWNSKTSLIRYSGSSRYHYISGSKAWI
ncbi:keratin, type II cytoskeletal 68 kDa, component IB-like isoform X2 [Centruroides vittatus]|uniref:keratin, type II cytoskeletal 68 kDa, component IB-like isoform X2 n=1 Tax=Centruroides vittatus TaxID=120091 RepID=UPI0035106E7A